MAEQGEVYMKKRRRHARDHLRFPWGWTSARGTIRRRLYASWVKQAVVFALIAAIFAGPVFDVRAASTGPNSPGTLADDSSVGDVTWTNPSNAGASDNSKATATISDTNTRTHYLAATNFGFSIPSTATIDGIAVDIERSRGITATGASISTGNTRIIKGGSVTGDAKSGSSAYTTTDTYETIGGATDLWGAALTASDVNASNFGVATLASFDIGSADPPASGQARIDHIRITVYYTEATTGTSGIARRYARAVFAGYAFPQATLFIHENGVPVKNYQLIEPNGKFEVRIEELEERVANFVFTFVDRDGRGTPPASKSVFLDSSQPPQEDISPPPTLSLQKAMVTRGEPIVLTGFASPRAQVDVMIDGKGVDTVTAGADGRYSSVINTASRNVTIGSHTVSVKQRFALRAGVSGVSLAKQVVVSAFGVVRGDFNDDGRVDIKDWSIFVAKRKDPAMLGKLDLNGDGKINVVDLSIFLRLFSAARGNVAEI